MSVKRLLDCTPSDLARYTKAVYVSKIPNVLHKYS